MALFRKCRYLAIRHPDMQGKRSQPGEGHASSGGGWVPLVLGEIARLRGRSQDVFPGRRRGAVPTIFSEEPFFKTLARWQLALFFFFIASGVPARVAGQDPAGPCVGRNPAAPFVKAAESATGSVESRATAYRKAIELCPGESSLYIGVTTLLIKAQRTADASAWVRRGLARWPRNADLSRNLGIVLLTEGDPQQALRVFEKLPESAQTHFELGTAYRALGEHDRARKELAAAYHDGQKDPYILYGMVQEDRALGDRAAGLKDFTTLDRDFPDSAWVHLLIGDAYSGRHDAAGASKEYQAAVALQPSMPIAHFDLGRLAFDRGDYAAAESEFRAELRVNPTFGDAHLYLGETLTREARNKEAVDELRMAVAYSPNPLLAYQALATAEDAAGRPEAALGTLKTGQKRFPEEAAFPAHEAQILKREGRVKEAAQEAALAETLSRGNNPMHYAGDSSEQAGTGRTVVITPGAERAPDRSQKVPTGDPSRGSEELTPSLGARPSASALASAFQALKSDPKNASAWITLGRLQQAAGDQAAAVKSFLEAQQLQPKSPLPVYSIGMSFFLLGLNNNADDYYQRAGRHFQDALELDPRYDRAIFMLGVIDVLRSKLSDAGAYLEKAITVSPRNSYYHLQYGVLLGRLGRAKEGIDEMKKAESLDPSNPRCDLNLGELYARDRDFRAARIELEKAIQLDPHLGAAYYTLGGVYHHLGLAAESERAYAAFQREKAKREDFDAVGEIIRGNNTGSSVPR